MLVIRTIRADEAQIKHLESVSAMTWEGMLLDEENLSGIADVFAGEQLVKEGIEEITGYFWFGK